LAAQALPQDPQLPMLLSRLMHCPEQSTVPDGHVQAPPEQKVPPEHTSPQPPQLLLSVCRSTHELPHAVRLVAHWAWHTPALQTGVADGQTFVHDPQWLASVCSLTHEPEQ
jgi:hypothetical protein